MIKLYCQHTYVEYGEYGAYGNGSGVQVSWDWENWGFLID